jgi:RNA polymerase subunit RPABC4/transcription elongation factor Spt4
MIGQCDQCERVSNQRTNMCATAQEEKKWYF